MLAEVPLILIGLGLIAYAVFGGADFGAGLWTLLARGENAERQREHAHRSIGPVWEADHVWLIFVLVLAWTAYPVAFASIASTLYVPLGLAAVGIIIRGAMYALQSTAEHQLGRRTEAIAFGVSSVLTPFALGAAVGAIASGRVPVGNAAGELIGSWVTLASFTLGALFVVTGAHLAAVHLAADAARRDTTDLADQFRVRSVASGVVAGALALGSLLVMRSDAPRLYDGLTGGAGLAVVTASAIAGLLTIVLLARRRYEPARVTAGVAVATVVAGWALAQRPELLPGLTVEEAAASRAVLWAIVVAAVIGAVILVPSLGYLYSLVLQGRFDEEQEGDENRDERGTPPPARPARVIAGSRAGAVLLPLGALGLFVAENGALQAVSVLVLLVGTGAAFAELASRPEV
jgi:cytochrome d ubiquinol oxidase subunit II